MMPILVSIGPVVIYSFSVFLIVAWGVFSFFFWRKLRDEGIAEDRIFDMTFTATMIGFMASRFGFVAFHWDLFADTYLKVFAMWVQPGLTLLPGLLVGIGVLSLMSKRYKISLPVLFDALVYSLPGAIAVGKVGSILDATETGLPTALPIAMRYAGHPEPRHPVQTYEILAILGMYLLLFIIRRVRKKPFVPGLAAVLGFMVLAFSALCIEFLKDSPVYLQTLKANQLVYLFVFGETVGVWYISYGGREKLVPGLKNVFTGIGSLPRRLKQKTGGIYDKLIHRSHQHPEVPGSREETAGTADH